MKHVSQPKPAKRAVVLAWFAAMQWTVLGMALLCSFVYSSSDGIVTWVG